MTNKVTKKECMKAIEYFWELGYIDECTLDQGHYLRILLNKVANDYKILLK